MTDACKYVPPEKLHDDFTALFVSDDALPTDLDVMNIFRQKLHGSCNAYLRQALWTFCMRMMDVTDSLYFTAQITLLTPVHSEPRKFTREACLQFFDELCQEILKPNNKIDVICAHFADIAKFWMFFTNMTESRLCSINSLFHTLFHFLDEYKLQKYDEPKLCLCELYMKTGKCSCSKVQCKKCVL